MLATSPARVSAVTGSRRAHAECAEGASYEDADESPSGDRRGEQASKGVEARAVYRS
ncbi:MAG: hypothetical protein QOF73_1332, partial [Thermomicrobiales bacterium]|nr:hypothetical protein [Thermomicrobiales bacterium]